MNIFTGKFLEYKLFNKFSPLLPAKQKILDILYDSTKDLRFDHILSDIASCVDPTVYGDIYGIRSYVHVDSYLAIRLYRAAISAKLEEERYDGNYKYHEYQSIKDWIERIEANQKLLTGEWLIHDIGHLGDQ
jgi:hypothetical protein